MNHKIYMQEAIRLAKLGTGNVSPNPRVGCVIVKNNSILSAGYHKHFGGNHAEVNAIINAPAEDLSRSVLYVNLEPCSHHGKTPPCTDRIIESGIRHVVIGIEDPNPLVKGRGILKLREQGVRVEIGIEERKSFLLNEMYIKSICKKTPFVTLKVAQTLDGFIATTQCTSKWITGESSRKYVHQLRREHDAVLAGIETCITDDAKLTVRHGLKRHPRRIILDSQLRIPLNSNILNLPDIQNTIIATRVDVSQSKINAVKDKGAVVWRIKSDKNGRIDLDAMLQKAFSENIMSVFVEGGQQVFSAFICQQLWDKYICFIAPKLFGDGLNPLNNLGILKPANAITFCQTEWHKREQDMIFVGRSCLQD